MQTPASLALSWGFPRAKADAGRLFRGVQASGQHRAPGAREAQAPGAGGAATRTGAGWEGRRASGWRGGWVGGSGGGELEGVCVCFFFGVVK